MLYRIHHVETDELVAQWVAPDSPYLEQTARSHISRSREHPIEVRGKCAISKYLNERQTDPVVRHEFVLGFTL